MTSTRRRRPPVGRRDPLAVPPVRRRQRTLVREPRLQPAQVSLPELTLPSSSSPSQHTGSSSVPLGRYQPLA